MGLSQKVIKRIAWIFQYLAVPSPDINEPYSNSLLRPLNWDNSEGRASKLPVQSRRRSCPSV